MTLDNTSHNHHAILRLLICCLFGTLVWAALPASLSATALISSAVFAALIISFFLKPFPMGMCVLVALIFLSGAHAITFDEVLEGFSDSVVWLVMAALMIARTVIDSQLSKRIALNLIHRFSSSPVSIAYAICLTELCLSPIISSNTARGGGIMSPIINSVIQNIKKSPNNDHQALSQYLVFTAVQANLITSAMFLTAMAANPLVSHYAKTYLNVDFNWLTWAMGSILPGLAALLGLPWLMMKFFKPGIINSKKVKAYIKSELQQLGPMAKNEYLISCVFISLIFLWATSDIHGFKTAQVAWFGVLALLVTNVLSWQRFIKNAEAWDILIWLGGLLTIVDMLRDHGVIAYFISHIQSPWLVNLPTLSALLLLVTIYFYSMYVCSMLTAHISAFVAAFFIVCANLATPPMLTAALFAYSSCLCACLTHYSTGPVVIYFAYKYIPIVKWLQFGFIISLYYAAIWLGVGLPWWRYLGWW